MSLLYKYSLLGFRQGQYFEDSVMVFNVISNSLLFCLLSVLNRS